MVPLIHQRESVLRPGACWGREETHGASPPRNSVWHLTLSSFPLAVCFWRKSLPKDCPGWQNECLQKILLPFECIFFPCPTAIMAIKYWLYNMSAEVASTLLLQEAEGIRNWVIYELSQPLSISSSKSQYTKLSLDLILPYSVIPVDVLCSEMARMFQVLWK